MPLGALGTAQGATDRWDRTVTKIEETLRKAGTNPAWRAQQLAEEALARQLNDIAQNPVNRPRLARLLALAGVAAYRLGETATAQWLLGEAAAFHGPTAGEVVEKFAADARELHSAIADGVVEEALRLFENPPDDYVAPEPQTMAPLRAAQFTRAGPVVGTARILIFVNPLGLAQRPLLLESSGHLGFDLAVMESAREWVFRPAIRQGQPSEGVYLLTVTLHGRS